MPADHYANGTRARLDSDNGPIVTVQGRDPGTGYVRVTRILRLKPYWAISWETTTVRLHPI